jgi:hypothetical protein
MPGHDPLKGKAFPAAPRINSGRDDRAQAVNKTETGSRGFYSRIAAVARDETETNQSMQMNLRPRLQDPTKETFIEV